MSGLHGQMVAARTVVMVMTPGDVDRISVLTIAIAAPQRGKASVAAP
jgi:hypothetical protein